MTPKKNGAKRLTVHVVIVVVLSITATVVVWAAIRTSDPTVYSITDETQTPAVEKLERLRQRYAAIKSVHIMAEARITLYGDNFRVGTGSYEYFAEGDRYKIECRTSKNLGFLPDVEVAYDGKRFYHLNHGSGILTYKNQDISTTIGALPNPLFMPVSFLSREDDSCRFCALRMTDFNSQSDHWSHRVERVKIKSQRKDPNTGQTFTDLELPGGTKAKRQLKINLRITDTPDGQLRTSRIDEITAEGKLVTSTTFADFFATALGQFPRTIVLEGFDENSNLLVRITYSIKTLEFNGAVDNTVFAISFDEA